MTIRPIFVPPGAPHIVFPYQPVSFVVVAGLPPTPFSGMTDGIGEFHAVVIYDSTVQAVSGGATSAAYTCNPND
ncbi:MAG: hypothetical protein WEE36_02880 [Acidimicrobiia bacterium]